MGVFEGSAKSGVFWRRCTIVICDKFGPHWGNVSPRYSWQRFYEDAILETNQSRLAVMIQAAHAAIDARKQQLQGNEGSAEEQHAIEDALANLRVLRQEAESD